MNRLGMIVLVIAMGALPCVAETFEEVEKQIRAATKKVKSMAADMKSEMNMKQEGFESKTLTVGKIETLREGDKIKMRMDSTSSTVVKVAGTESKQEQKMLVVSDGVFSYSLVDSAQGKMAIKSKAQKTGDVPWGQASEGATFKVLPDEKIDGEDCFVVEMRVAGGSGGGSIGRTVFYCRKDFGIQVKSVGYTPDDKVMMTTTFTNIKLNEKISADRFVFKAPAGVTVTDMTGA